MKVVSSSCRQELGNGGGWFGNRPCFDLSSPLQIVTSNEHPLYHILSALGVVDLTATQQTQYE